MKSPDAAPIGHEHPLLRTLAIAAGTAVVAVVLARKDDVMELVGSIPNPFDFDGPNAN